MTQETRNTKCVSMTWLVTSACPFARHIDELHWHIADPARRCNAALPSRGAAGRVRHTGHPQRARHRRGRQRRVPHAPRRLAAEAEGGGHLRHPLAPAPGWGRRRGRGQRRRQWRGRRERRRRRGRRGLGRRWDRLHAGDAVAGDRAGAAGGGPRAVHGLARGSHGPGHAARVHGSGRGRAVQIDTIKPRAESACGFSA